MLFIIVSTICIIRSIYPIKYIDEVEFACEKTQLQESLIFAIIKAESSFDSNALSNKGARGLMQILPGTAGYVAKLNAIEEYDLYFPKDNILIGTYYIKYLIDKFDSIEYALLAYNGGEGRVSNFLELGFTSYKDFQYQESVNYVNKVLEYKQAYDKILFIHKRF